MADILRGMVTDGEVSIDEYAKRYRPYRAMLCRIVCSSRMRRVALGMAGICDSLGMAHMER